MDSEQLSKHAGKPQQEAPNTLKDRLIALPISAPPSGHARRRRRQWRRRRRKAKRREQRKEAKRGERKRKETKPRRKRTKRKAREHAKKAWANNRRSETSALITGGIEVHGGLTV